ncbi:MAG: FCD domain-containing protein [Rhodospirillaceae bacterium]
MAATAPHRKPEDLEMARRAARTLVEFAYEAIRQDILCGALAPGEKLRVEVLKEHYQVGSSTLREALTLLVADALVTAEGQRGFRVTPISLDDIRDITEMRKMLETQALRRSIERGGDEWEANLVAAWHRLSKVEERIYDDPQGLSAEWEERNKAFHEALIGACQSHWLHHFRDILYHQSERYRRIALTGRTVPRNVHEEHRAIFEATMARDADTACAHTAEHIDRTLQALSCMFQDGDAPMPERRAAAGAERRG